MLRYLSWNSVPMRPSYEALTSNFMERYMSCDNAIAMGGRRRREIKTVAQSPLVKWKCICTQLTKGVIIYN